jgi:hypothetical protein
MTPTNKYIIILICLVSLAVIVYKFNQDEDTIENFESNLSKLKNKNNSYKKKNKTKSSFFNITGGNSNDNSDNHKTSKSGATFNDLMNMTEKMKPQRYTYDNIKEEIQKYSKSFNKEKFKNNSKDTTEALEKFSLYKKKFFEIFD